MEELTRESGFLNDTYVPSEPWQGAVSSILFKYILPVLIFSGTVGNLVSLLVLQSPHFNKNPCSVLLSVLVFVDTGVLLTGPLGHWIPYIGGPSVRTLSVWGCKVHVFFSYLFPQLSSGTLTVMTLERTVSVVSPLRSKLFYTRTRIIIVWAVVAIVITALDAHLLAIVDIVSLSQNNTGDNHTGSEDPIYCHVSRQHEDYFLQVWPWLDFVTIALVPAIIIIVSNALIIYTLLHSRSRHIRSTTSMLVALSIFFVVAVFPAQVYFVAWPYWFRESENLDNQHLTYSICYIMNTCNSSFNVVLYCISGQKFRQAFVSMICCRSRWASSSSRTLQTQHQTLSRCQSAETTNTSFSSHSIQTSTTSTIENNENGT